MLLVVCNWLARGHVPFKGSLSFLRGATGRALVVEEVREVPGLDVPEHVGPGVVGEGLAQGAGGALHPHHDILPQVLRALDLP